MCAWLPAFLATALARGAITGAHAASAGARFGVSLTAVSMLGNSGPSSTGASRQRTFDVVLDDLCPSSIMGGLGSPTQHRNRGRYAMLDDTESSRTKLGCLLTDCMPKETCQKRTMCRMMHTNGYWMRSHGVASVLGLMD
jgi:hypothetical protein